MNLWRNKKNMNAFWLRKKCLSGALGFEILPQPGTVALVGVRLLNIFMEKWKQKCVFILSKFDLGMHIFIYSQQSFIMILPREDHWPPACYWQFLVHSCWKHQCGSIISASDLSSHVLRTSTPTFDYLPWQIIRIASKYIYNLWQLRQGVDSLAQWLEHWIFNREDRVRIPGKTGYFFSYALFLCYNYHVVRHGHRFKSCWTWNLGYHCTLCHCTEPFIYHTFILRQYDYDLVN